MRRTTFESPGRRAPAVVFVVEDDDDTREGMRRVLGSGEFVIADFSSTEAFLAAYQPSEVGCLLLDAFMPGAGGMALLRHMRTLVHDLPVVMITGRGCVSLAVDAMRHGAFDFIEKPAGRETLIAAIGLALAESRRLRGARDERGSSISDLASLTSRQKQILGRILAGVANRAIAVELGISQRTVENHRATVMRKMGAHSVAQLTRMAVMARWAGLDAIEVSEA